MRTVAKPSVGDRHRTYPHLDPDLLGAAPSHGRCCRDRMRGMRVAVRVAPRPVLSGYRELALDALEVRPEVPVGDRPVRGHTVARPDLEVRWMKARRVTREMGHRSTHADARVVLAQLDRILARD